MNCLLGCLLLALATWPRADAAAPTVESDAQGGILISVLDKLLLRTGDGDSSEVMTEATTMAYLDEERTMSRSMVNDEIKAALNKIREEQAGVTGEIETKSDARAQKLETRISTLESQVKQLSDALELSSETVQAILENQPPKKSCGEYGLEDGVELGHGTLPGAVRLLRCSPGFRMVGDSTVVCHVDGTWSAKTECLATTTATTSTTTPRPSERVTCCMHADNDILQVYTDTDGEIKRNTALSSPRTAYDKGRPLVFQFESTAKVLGIRAMDGECGCSCGGFAMYCGTPSGKGGWNVFTNSSASGSPFTVWTGRKGMMRLPSDLSAAWMKPGFEDESFSSQVGASIRSDHLAESIAGFNTCAVPLGVDPGPYGNFRGVCDSVGSGSHQEKSPVMWYFRYEVST